MFDALVWLVVMVAGLLATAGLVIWLIWFVFGDVRRLK